jgi:hypothetical protein
MAPVLREAFCDGAADAAACSSDDGDALVYDCTLRAEPVGGGILQERRGEHRGHRWTEQVARLRQRLSAAEALKYEQPAEERVVRSF